VLHVVKPLANGPGGYTAAEDVTMQDTIGPALSVTQVRLRFTAPRRESSVTPD
jgi:hypothetical protein